MEGKSMEFSLQAAAGKEEYGVQPSGCGRERRAWSSAFRLRQGKKSMEFSLQAATSTT